ncbi:phage tail fiber protein [Paenibacillus sp. sgz302251]|uniref:phage tail fiber protein n=1 Tax=Paenibacillus sp. sgz302251 TaxID=3414493 RepID=UPI003C7C157D
MPGSLSNYAENNVLDTLLSGTKYVGLFTDAAGISADQPTTELTGTGYARQAVTHAAASGGTKATNSAVTFTAGAAWPTVNYVGVWDAATAGNLLYWASCSPETLANTNTLTIAAGALSISGD